MEVHTFYRKYNSLKEGEKFLPIEVPKEATSLFIIAKELERVRASRRYLEEREVHLLNIAEDGFNQLEEK